MSPRQLGFPAAFVILIASLLATAASFNGTGEAHARPLADGAPPFNSRIVSMAVTPESPSSIYALVDTISAWESGSPSRFQLYSSRDGGMTWSNAGREGLGEITGATSIAVDYRHPGVLYLAATTDSYSYGSYSLYRSSGGPWEKLSGPIEGLSALAVDLKDSNVLYAGARYGALGGFIRSTDGGRTWKPFDNQWPDPTQLLPGNVWRAPVERILVDPVNPEVLYASAVWSYRYYEGRLFRGDRNGNWSEMAAPRASGGVLAIQGIAFDPATRSMYLGSGPWGGGGTVDSTARKLWMSANPAAPDPAGVKWTEVTSFDLGRWGWQATVPSVDPLAIDAGQGTAIYLQTHAADAALWRSADLGRSWQPLPMPRPVFTAPGTEQAFSWTAPDTGHTVSGEWLRFLKAHGDTDNLGYARSEVIADPMAAGQTVQYFQRLILEWHPESPPEFRIQRRLLGDLLYPGANPPLDPEDAGARPPGEYAFFPNGQGIGLGHYVANSAPDGSPTYFKEYFDSHGGVDAFGFPKEEPKVRNGMWTQRFQAAVFEYHPANDMDGFLPGTTIPWRNYRVQLELLGDRYVEMNKLTYK